jgi:hypothetical protein
MAGGAVDTLRHPVGPQLTDFPADLHLWRGQSWTRRLLPGIVGVSV